ncbi:DUF1672 family protein [Staphylococcus pettenkoferi]|uniref:DUF1672 domain-containing protein n=1 Tax=Staphylococcus pettenkoferi TaxID=170573 RepID=A0A9Q4D568_9STAP|nr:DUF1672 family protein [Staphylococcus pettenkoferi]MCY1569704.1 DUF1672 domain-containing protein [Staphylococcus pettenkoferi]MCY1575097.1 DUF1672 domain-containing protein [Staphylococcus pettenkoferi]MCY1595246.1 DUF1672 domain-containing protein [Staphylococcus pettenkoferi]MCY1618611.1 DUF1672 domain-containing protein [Staphylococcus pettenkoferi]
MFQEKVPDRMPAQEYKGQGYKDDPHVDRKSIHFAKKHRKSFEKSAIRFFKDNFSLNVKVTKFAPIKDGAIVYIHCDDHDIQFNASLSLAQDDIDEDKSMKVNEDGDNIANMLEHVLTGFEYRAHKKQYDHLYNYLNKNKDKYHYTGYTKEAIVNTQADGYANEYFYICYTPEQLSTYKKYYEPLIKMNQKDFEEGMKRARKATHYEAKPEVVTTLFSTKKESSEKYNFKMATQIAKSIEKNNTNMPTTSSIDVMYTGNQIRTQKPYWGGQNSSSYQIF